MLNRFYFVLFFVLLAIVVVVLFVTPTISASAETASVSAFIPYTVSWYTGDYIDLPSEGNGGIVTANGTLSFAYRTSANGEWISFSMAFGSCRFVYRNSNSKYIDFYVNNQGLSGFPNVHHQGSTWYYCPDSSTYYIVRDDSLVVQSDFEYLGVSSSYPNTRAVMKTALTPITAVIELTSLPTQYVASAFAPDLPIDSVYSVSLYNVSIVDYSLEKYVDNEWQVIDSALYSGADFTIVFYESGQYRLSTYDTTTHSYIYSNAVNVQFDLWQRPYNIGCSIGFDEGYRDGMQEAPDILPSLIFAVPDTIIGMLIGTYDTNPDSDTYHTYVGGLFNFSLFGYDMRDFIVSLVCIVVIVKLIALILGGAGKEE